MFDTSTAFNVPQHLYNTYRYYLNGNQVTAINDHMGSSAISWPNVVMTQQAGTADPIPVPPMTEREPTAMEAWRD